MGEFVLLITVSSFAPLEITVSPTALRLIVVDLPGVFVMIVSPFGLSVMTVVLPGREIVVLFVGVTALTSLSTIVCLAGEWTVLTRSIPPEDLVMVVVRIGEVTRAGLVLVTMVVLLTGEEPLTGDLVMVVVRMGEETRRSS